MSIILVAVSARGQELQPEEDLQSWNDLQVTIPLTKKLDFQTQFTARIGKDISRLNDGRFSAGAVWKPNKWIAVNPFYWYINARNANSVFRTENRWNLRGTFRFPVKAFGLSHRSWYEYRVRQPLKAWRYRASLTIEKELPKKFGSGVKVFAANEVFYDSLLDRFSRNRFSVGINKTFSEKFNIDLYYMRQNDGVSRPGDLHVIWTALKIKLQ